MVGHLLRVTGTALAMATALVTPVLATATATPAAADTVVDGCTIVSNPTPTHFTNCPNANLSNGVNFSGIDLSFADLAGAQFISCMQGFPQASCTSADFVQANLTQANLSGASLSLCALFMFGHAACGAADFTGAILSRADLAQASAQIISLNGAHVGGANLTSTDLGGANLTKADLSGANLTGTLFSSSLAGIQTVYATLTGSNLTGTLLVPSNQSVTATSQAGAVATWSTPPAIPGAMPGSCTPASGSTFPLFSSTVTCQVLDNNGDTATGTFQVNVAPTTQFFTRVLIPADGAVLAGAPYLDALAGDGPGVTNVVFELSGGTLSHQVIATATPTYYGWLAKWNTTSVPNGTYTLQSAATDAAANTDTSDPVTITVKNQPPTTAVLIPSNGATVSGATALLDASASSAIGVSSVTFELSGGTLSDHVIATATPTYYGWLVQWNTTSVPNGTYTLQSVATDTVAESAPSAPVTVTVDNPAPSTAVIIPSTGATQSGTSALLDASASANVTSVTFELSGGTLSDHVIATGTPTYYGWLVQWNTTSVPNGTYTLQSVASCAGGVSGTSQGIMISIAN